MQGCHAARSRRQLKRREHKKEARGTLDFYRQSLFWPWAYAATCSIKFGKAWVEPWRIILGRTRFGDVASKGRAPLT